MSETPDWKIPYVPENTLDPAAGLNLSLLRVDEALTEVNENAEAASVSASAAILSDAQGTGFVDRLAANCYLSGQYVRETPGTSNIEIGYRSGGGTICAYDLTADIDGMYIIKGGKTGVQSPGQLYNFMAENLTGAFVSSPPNSNAYTTEVGATFDLTFTGTDLNVRHYSNNQGGLWQITVDSEDPVEMSVFSSSVSANNVQQVISGLADTEHTAVFEFLGADPANPPTGTARGWFRYLPTPGSDNTFTAYSHSYIGYEEPFLARDTAKDIVSPASIFDFAISTKPSGAAFAADWVPSHSGAVGATQNIETFLELDGELVAPSSLTQETLSADRVVLTQKYTAHCTNDPEDTELWSGTLVRSFDKGVLTISHYLEYSADAEQTGYLVQLPVSLANVDLLRTAYADDTLEIPGSNQSTNLSTATKSAIFISDPRTEAISVQFDSYADAIGEGVDPDEPGLSFYTERTDGVGKLYWKRFDGEETSSGSKVRCQARYLLAANVKDADFLI